MVDPMLLELLIRWTRILLPAVIGFFLMLFFLGAQHAYAGVCGPYDQQKAMLAKFGEKPVAEFKTNKDELGVVVFINGIAKTVTVLQEFSKDNWCFVAGGKRFRLITGEEQSS